MPDERQPDRFTKSIVLAGGISEDTPELLRQLPALAYIENGRFRKENEVEKTLPEQRFNQVDPGTGFVEGLGDTVASRFGSDIYEYDSSGNVVGLSPADFTRNEKTISTDSVGGASNFSWGVTNVAGVDPITVIAYEIRTGWDDDLLDKQVIIEAYNTLGRRIRRVVAPLATAPVVSTNTNGNVLVHYHSTGLNALRVYNYATGTTSNVGAVPRYGNPIVEALLDPGSSLPIKGYNALRYGFMKSGRNAWFQVHYRGAAFGDGVLVYTSAIDNSVYAYKLDENGIVTGPATTVYADAFASIAAVPLDVKIIGPDAAGTDNRIWIMMYYKTAGTGQGELNTATYPLDLSGIPDVNTLFQGNETALNGRLEETLLAPDGETIHFAFTSHGGGENTQDMATDNGGVRAEYGTIHRTLGVTYWGRIHDHAVSSNPTRDAEGNLYFTCEQALVSEPYTEKPAPAPENLRIAIPSAMLKPVTTYLIKATPTTYTPISAFDVNSSKHVNPSMYEQQARVARLTFGGSKFKYLNRQLLQAEDGSLMFVQPNDDDQLPTPIFGKRNHLFGEYKANLYEITIDVPDVRTWRFGDGFIADSAIPFYYGRGEVSEIGVLEQPEIVSFFQVLDGPSTPETIDAEMGWTYNTITDNEVDKWITVQVVVGFVDSAGFVHRSAPSLPVFVRGVRPEDTTYDNRYITFTTPLTMRTGQPFFVEVFESAYGEVPQLAATKTFTPNPANPISIRASSLMYDGQLEYTKGEVYPVRSSEFVYTGGDAALAADPWEDFDFLAITSRRIFFAKGSTIYYTKLFEENVAPERNAVLNIPFGRNKKITALGTIDDKVIVFERDTIHAIYGDGPDNAGVGGPFIVDRIQSNVGCSSPDSLVEVPEGLAFYSNTDNNFHLLTRDLNVVTIGDQVQDLADGITVNCSVNFPAESEIRWYVTPPAVQEEFGPEPETGDNIPTRPPRPRFQNILPANPALAFNYSEGKWTVLSGQPAVDVTIFDDKILRASGAGLYATSDNWAGSELLKYRTPWVQVQDLQNHGRIDEIILLGQYLSAWRDDGDGFQAGDIKVTTRYNYEEGGNYHEYLWRANKELSAEFGQRLQFSMKPGQPKCQAIQILIEEVPTTKLDDKEPDYTTGRGFVLSGLDLLCKPKRGFGSKSLAQSRSK